jgi:TPR repeat protein
VLRGLICGLFVIALIGCAATPSPAPRSEYNQGVDAYQQRDYVSARRHWANAIDEHDVSALNNLGYLLFSGLGGELDQRGGVALWQKAASLGHSESQLHLGYAHEVGEGTGQSLIEAYAWYRCALVNAQSTAKDDSTESHIAQDAGAALSRLLEKLPPALFADSEKLAKQYIEKFARAADV